MSITEQFGSLGQQISTKMQKSGVILAKVTNIKDPENLNRILCKPISEDKDVAETDWCFCMTPMAGSGYGQFFFPNVDDLVVIAYVGGDIHHPIVLGRYWANEVNSPYTIQDGKNEVASIMTPTGTEVHFDDVKEKQKVTVTLPSGAKLQINDEEKSIAAASPKDENTLTINWESGEIELKAKTKLTLRAGKTTLTLDSNGNITGKGSSAVVFEGADVSVMGKSSVKLDGAKVEANASGVMKLSASGINTIKGAMVKIN